jgi:hypothetical protein
MMMLGRPVVAAAAAAAKPGLQAAVLLKDSPKFTNGALAWHVATTAFPCCVGVLRKHFV